MLRELHTPFCLKAILRGTNALCSPLPELGCSLRRREADEGVERAKGLGGRAFPNKDWRPILLTLLALMCLTVSPAGAQKEQSKPKPVQDNVLTRKEKRDGWILLFDGKSLDSWMTSTHSPSRKP